jgi:hypothetical protein
MRCLDENIRRWVVIVAVCIILSILICACSKNVHPLEPKKVEDGHPRYERKTDNLKH